jgi:hypothetical protein
LTVHYAVRSNESDSSSEDDEDEDKHRQYDDEVASLRLAERNREERRLAAAEQNPDEKIFHRGLAPKAPELRLKPWEPVIKARPNKKWKPGRATKNTFYFERAARSLLNGAECAKNIPPDVAVAGALLVAGQLGTRRGWAGTEKDPAGTPIKDLLGPLSMGAADQVAAVSMAYDSMLNEAGCVLNEERCPWFNLHSERLPQTTSTNPADAGIGQQQGEGHGSMDDEEELSVHAMDVAPTIADAGSVSEDLLVGAGQRLNIRFAPLKQAAGWTMPASARAALGVTYDVPAETTKLQLQELIIALLGAEQSAAVASGAGDGDGFEFWVGRNGADGGGVRLGRKGQRYCTVASAAVRSGGGLERTVLVEVAPEGGNKAGHGPATVSNDIDID